MFMLNYYKDGYKISPSMQQYLTSPMSDCKRPLESPQLDPQQRDVYPICWDTSDVPYCIKSPIYKCTDRRSSAEAAQRARNLTAKRKQLQSIADCTSDSNDSEELSEQDKTQHKSNKNNKRPRLSTSKRTLQSSLQMAHPIVEVSNRIDL